MKKRESAAITLAKNLHNLMKSTDMKKSALAIKSGVSERMIAYILTGERMPTIEIIEQLADALGVEVWEMMLRNLVADVKRAKRLKTLVENYQITNDAGRDYIDHVAEREVEYVTNKPGNSIDMEANNGSHKMSEAP